MAAGELKHGTLALIEKGTPVILLNPKDESFADSLSNGMEAKARGAKIIALSNAENENYDLLFKLPACDSVFYPILEVVPLQLLAYYSAVERGKNPDKPRNLAKSVTVK
ncbi:MAG TPA: SIS domain-containing protein [Candidatus Norongarragalinales archaeon]|nr:SIS domain-containing protein [Candidatus Norongarragalinales archaeon]